MMMYRAFLTKAIHLLERVPIEKKKKKMQARVPSAHPFTTKKKWVLKKETKNQCFISTLLVLQTHDFVSYK